MNFNVHSRSTATGKKNFFQSVAFRALFSPERVQKQKFRLNEEEVTLRKCCFVMVAVANTPVATGLSLHSTFCSGSLGR